MRAGRLQRPLAGRLPLPGVRLPPALPHPLPQAPAVPCLPPARAPSSTGTICAATQLPLTVRLLALHLLTQGKHGVSSLELARQPGVSRNTAWKVKHKLLQVMKERDERVPPGGIMQVDDACWGGERSGGKRGRGAAGKTPFVAAVQVSAAGQPARMRMSSVASVAGLRKKTLAAWAGRHLQPGTEVHSDGPACFRGVADAGCEHVPTVTGGGQRSCGDSRFFRVNTMRANVKQSLAGTCHALDGKHLPRHLAEFRYRFNRRYDLQALVPRLLHRLRAHPAQALPPPNLG